jgi:hypothetical protein
VTSGEGKGSSSESISRTSKSWRIAFVLALILLCAVLALIVVLLIRSGFFKFGAPITDTQYKALWTFLASALGAAVTLIGLTLTSSHNARTLALQSDMENRKSIAVNDAENRQKLQAAVEGLQLISTSEGRYAVSAQVAGSLATLVHLGHPVIAMRVLRAAWSDGPVDVDTAVWLINEVLEKGSRESQFEASSLLCEHAADLCDGRDGHEGEFSWPSLLYNKWPIDQAKVCRFEILFAVVRVVISKTKDWWGFQYDWSLALLDEAIEKDPDAVLKNCARHLLEPLAKSYAVGYDLRSEIKLPWGDQTKDLSAIENRTLYHQGIERITKKTQDLVEELKRWGNPGASDYRAGKAL